MKHFLYTGALVLSLVLTGCGGLAVAPEIALDQAETYMDRENYTQALQEYEKVLKVDPDHFIAYMGRSECQARLGNVDGQIWDYDELLQRNSYEAEVFFLRGMAKRGEDQLRSALMDLDRCLELSPFHAEAYAKRALIHAKLGNESQSIADQQKAEALLEGLQQAG